MKKSSLLFALLAAGAATPAFGQYTLTTLATFGGNDTFFAYDAQPVYPWAPPIVSGNTLYGTTANSTYPRIDGMVYSLPTTGGTPHVLATFKSGQGLNPQTALILSGGTLYGTTQPANYQGNATVFSVPVGGGTPQTLATFNGFPNPSSLILSGGMLYGTTEAGGAYGNGTVFSVPAAGGNLTTLASFNGTNGGYPFQSNLILSGGTLYGAVEGGGANGVGTVISVPVTGGNISVLGTFNGTNGSYPESNLILSGGNLYGLAGGGANNHGVVYSVPVTGGNITTLASFNGTNGANPAGNIVADSSGNLYGLTTSGGDNGGGTVFSVPMAGGNITALVSFNMAIVAGLDGEPGLCIDDSGNLYGTTGLGGPYNEGMLFEAVAPVPEPASLALLAAGSIGLLARRRRRKE